MTNKQNILLFIIDLRGMKGLLEILRGRTQEQFNLIHLNYSQSVYQGSGTVPEQEAFTFKFSFLKECSVLGGVVSLSYKTE